MSSNENRFLLSPIVSNPSLWKIRTLKSYRLTTMVFDDLAVQGTKVSAALVLIYFSLKFTGLSTIRINISRPKQNRWHFADNIFKSVFLKKNQNFYSTYLAYIVNTVTSVIQLQVMRF